MTHPPAYVLLEDGTRFDGDAVRRGPDDAVVTGEVVFTTGMSGYQESMTDPSFAASSSPSPTRTWATTASRRRRWSPSARGRARRSCARPSTARTPPGAERGWLDWLGDCGVPAITGVDTRALVRHIRDAGAMRGGVFPAAVSEAEARERIAAEPPMAGLDLAREVTPGAP